MKKIAIAAIVLVTLAFGTAPANAQRYSQISSSGKQADTEVTSEVNLNRAKNLARQAAEKANGGVTQYTAEAAMHGPPLQAPFVENSDGTSTFTFVGGSPGYQTPTIESVVTVDPNTWTVSVDYNGPIRPPSR